MSGVTASSEGATTVLAELEAPLPAELARFGASVRGSLYGAGDTPVIVALGGISANRFPYLRPDGSSGWWSGLFGGRGGIDPREFRILGIDFAADESGTTAPSTADQAAVICAALDAVGVDAAHAIIGASYGGMAALSLGQHFPARAERLVIVCAGAEPHSSSTAFRELQRRVVALGLAASAGDEGLAIARGLAMISYRTQAEFAARFAGGIADEDVLSCSEPGAYLRARGTAYRRVMSPQRFLSLSASIDRHRVDPGLITLPTLLIGALSDQLVPPEQMQALAERLSGPTRLELLPSLYGHDMFLKNADQVAELAGPFLRSES